MGIVNKQLISVYETMTELESSGLLLRDFFMLTVVHR